ncbi:hypothetical protein FNJ84_07305 [Paracoccus sp. M683]|uniref:DUF5671 domain-containing protein n=1 Tax=Paracoccus sp. M683 TaxID=2594268 RepID=UPI00117FB9FB|nr:DUF5671 domain-containing protein [Paracoccus sp. M683]TRW97319.1 hypothetical protein FNJ84_07305 [Paracoccus sp. M683]
MKAADILTEFVRDGLSGGADRPALAEALRNAGWAEAEVQAALGQWADMPGLPPVPRPTAYVSAREALLYGLLFIALGVVASHIVILGFGIINYLLPDPFEYYTSSGTGLRWPIAALIAFLPLFLYVNRQVNRGGGDDALRKRSLVRRWVASVTMLIAMLTLLGDLVTVVYVFLNGDLSLRFVAKAGLVAVMGVLVLAYYRDEMDG